MKKFFNSDIKLNELYGAVEKHSKVHIQNFDEKRVETSLSLFNPSVLEYRSKSLRSILM